MPARISEHNALKVRDLLQGRNDIATAIEDIGKSGWAASITLCNGDDCVSIDLPVNDARNVLRERLHATEAALRRSGIEIV